MSLGMKVKVAILGTGGIDSTTLIYERAREDKELRVVYIDYGQAVASVEHRLLTFHCARLGLRPPVRLELRFPEWQKRGGLFKRGFVPEEDDPLGNWDKLRYEESFIEGRNAFMVLRAIAWCVKEGVEELWAGYTMTRQEWDHVWSYRLSRQDNTPTFVDAINLLIQHGFSRPLRFRAPYYERRMDKGAIMELGRAVGVPWHKTYSCYYVPPCGRCDNCLLRAKYLSSVPSTNASGGRAK